MGEGSAEDTLYGLLEQKYRENFLHSGRERGRTKYKHRINVMCNLTNPQEPADADVSCCRNMIAYERVVTAGGGRPRTTMTLYTRALSTVP